MMTLWLTRVSGSKYSAGPTFSRERIAWASALWRLTRAKIHTSRMERCAAPARAAKAMDAGRTPSWGAALRQAEAGNGEDVSGFCLAPSSLWEALNRALATAEIHGPAAGREALLALDGDRRMTSYPFYWGALAEIARREGDAREAARFYGQAISVSRSRAERTAYERTLRSL
jgi:hypothetical protein